MGHLCIRYLCIWLIIRNRFLCIGFLHSFVYTSGHCRRWRSRMEVKIMAGSLFVHCKISYFYSVTVDKWLIVSLPNFVTIRRTHFSVSCKIFSWIRSTKLKIHAVEFCDFIKDSVSPSGLFVPCSLTHHSLTASERAIIVTRGSWPLKSQIFRFYSTGNT